MRFLLRITMGVATVLSSLILAVLLFVWVRSYCVSDDIARECSVAEGKFWSWTFLHAGCGQFVFVRHTIIYRPGNPRDPTGVKWDWQRAKPSATTPQVAQPSGNLRVWQWGQMWHCRRELTVDYGLDRCDWWGVPLWCMVLPTSLVPVIFLARFVATRRRNRRQRAGLCPVCEYDVRATRQRCPECGTQLTSGQPA